jgi:hypothetical protein
MGSIDFHIAALQGGSANQATENAQVAQAQPARPVLPAREVPAASPPKAEQDTVSVSVTLLPQRQQTAPSRGNAQPATFALLSQTTTFPPSQNSAAAFTTSAFPNAATQTTNQQNVPAVIAAPVTQTAVAAQSSVATTAATVAASTAPANASNAAPAQQTLQQLDRVLQQLGIDPQTLSLISREGMLNWVNDPAALRQIVQNVQAAASTSQQNDAVGAANPTRSAAQASVASANQDQIQPQTLSEPQAAAQETNPAAASASASSSANTNALDQSAAAAQQNATAVMQFQKLQDSLAPSGAAETQPAANSGSTATAQGRLLNVSA